MNEDIHFRVLKVIQGSPEITQRELADELGVSLGKANYCLRAMIEQGWLKAQNFKNSNRKMAYTYLLTSAGIEEKAAMTVRFLKRKIDEYEALKEEIEELRLEVGSGKG